MKRDSDDPRPETRLLLAGSEDVPPERLIELVYDELRRCAAHFLQAERPDHTLEATALVHEAYARLVGSGEIAWRDHRHFFSTAARAMRRILVDHARSKGREKRGGGRERVSLQGASPQDQSPATGDDVDVVRLHSALEELARQSARKAEIVELRYFAGLEVAAIAKILNVSERTVSRDWRFARAWLLERLERPQDESA